MTKSIPGLVHHRLVATRGQRRTNPVDPALIGWCVSMREVLGAAVGPTLPHGHYVRARGWRAANAGIT
ncbi:hypothetical protein PGT21_027585 [Puccinia graminis f. sp. tritici]|uniref:Uncharacterized protein n=1 Tax=Puccinia graminis f. sp. tritici TaxID=56615 RepID=A0A5B0QCH6_PUCGR|nr:hypothetical protein PGT21_027585 [Puccinia graminis f. sp. tritici]